MTAENADYVKPWRVRDVVGLVVWLTFVAALVLFGGWVHYR